MKAPKRFIHSHHIAEGVKTVAALQQQALKVAPHMAGPMSRIPMAAQPEQEVMEHHCLNCGDQKQFTVEGEQKMKNGSIRKYGTGECGHKMSKFVSGAQDGAA